MTVSFNLQIVFITYEPLIDTINDKKREFKAYGASVNQQLKMKLPMWVTSSRMLLGPILFVCMAFPAPSSTWLAAIIFTIGSITDWLDGHLARKFNAQSNMGKFMDPIADKVIVLAALLIFIQQGKIEPIMVFLLISRDIVIGGVRSIAAVDGVVIDAKAMGKYKTALQMISIPCLFIETFLNLPLLQIGYWGLWLSVVLSFISGADYVLKYLTNKPAKERQM